MKIDVEGAEWDSFRTAPDELPDQIDQMAVEFHWVQDGEHHWVQDEKYQAVVERLKRFFQRDATAVGANMSAVLAEQHRGEPRIRCGERGCATGRPCVRVPGSMGASR